MEPRASGAGQPGQPEINTPPRAAHMRAVGDLPTYGYEGSRKSISATSTARRPWEIAVAGLASRLTLDSTASGEVEHRHGPRGVAADTGRTRARRPRGFLADGDITGLAMHRAWDGARGGRRTPSSSTPIRLSRRRICMAWSRTPVPSIEDDRDRR